MVYKDKCYPVGLSRIGCQIHQWAAMIDTESGWKGEQRKKKESEKRFKFCIVNRKNRKKKKNKIKTEGKKKI